MKFTILIMILVILTACTGQSRLERILALAGDNRTELERTLEHYSKDPADSLKYRAACFLIMQMPHCHFGDGPEYEDFMRRAINFCQANDLPVTRDSLRMLYINMYDGGYGKLWTPAQTVYDLQVITAEYLIENIDLSFRVWRETPWGHTVSFERFCEEILPYRVGSEPLENWRKLYYEAWKPALDSLTGEEKSLKEAGEIIYDRIYSQRWMFDSSVTGSDLGAEALFHSRLGDCRLMANYAVYVFRALGIPCGIDCILQNPDMKYAAHYWNYMKDESGKSISFELYQKESSPASGNSNKINRKKGKTYRMYYGMQEESYPLKYRTGNIPPPLDNKYIVDVSGEYFKGAAVTVYIDKKRRKGKLMYLGVFNNRTWIPVACAEIKKGKAVFSNVDVNIVYQPLFYHEKKLYPASAPLIAETDGNCRILNPDTLNCRTVTVSRKHPLPPWYDMYRHRTAGGRFEGANRADFSDAVTLYTHRDSLIMNWYRIPVDCPGKFRYLRYCSAVDGHCNMAEIRFISSGRILKGKIIGTDGILRKKTRSGQRALFLTVIR
jgi:hypothetical protein